MRLVLSAPLSPLFGRVVCMVSKNHHPFLSPPGAPCSHLPFASIVHRFSVLGGRSVLYVGVFVLRLKRRRRAGVCRLALAGSLPCRRLTDENPQIVLFCSTLYILGR